MEEANGLPFGDRLEVGGKGLRPMEVGGALRLRLEEGQRAKSMEEGRSLRSDGGRGRARTRKSEDRGSARRHTEECRGFKARA